MRFQVSEEDLADLERLLPVFQELILPMLAHKPEIGPRYRVTVRRVKEILSNIRWDYGPYGSVDIVGGDEE